MSRINYNYLVINLLRSQKIKIIILLFLRYVQFINAIHGNFDNALPRRFRIGQIIHMVTAAHYRITVKVRAVRSRNLNLYCLCHIIIGNCNLIRRYTIRKPQAKLSVYACLFSRFLGLQNFQVFHLRLAFRKFLLCQPLFLFLCCPFM